MAAAQAGLAVQVAEVIKDMTELRQELRDHRKEHEDAERARAVGRRWAISLAVTGIAAVGGIYPLLIGMHH
jgi:hypothetical protein